MRQASLTSVSRETSERLDQFVALLKKWNPKINLVSRASEPDIWERHIQDSAQIFQLFPSVDRWADLGSGGGFPGIVLAAIARECDPNRQTVLVESDQRKAAFLRTAVRELGLNATVQPVRIEACPPLGATVVSARALADLSKLLRYVHPHLCSSGRAILPKGKTWRAEVEVARIAWSFDLKVHDSRTDSEAAILEIGNIERV